LDFRGRFFVVPTVFFINNTFAVYEGERRAALLDVTQRGLGLDFGRQIGEWAEFRAGVYRGYAGASVNTGDVAARPRSLDVGGLQSRLVITRVDAPTFPSNGTSFAANYRRSSRSLGASDDYSKLSALGDVFITRGKQTLIVGLGGGTGFGSNLPVYDEFRLGGLLNLSAYPEGQIHGAKFALFRLGTYRRVRTLSGYFGKTVYAGGLFETGKAWQSSERTNLEDLKRSAGVFIGANTVLGPVIVAYARAETGHDRVYFTIGKTF
jgi:NTE family protein